MAAPTPTVRSCRKDWCFIMIKFPITIGTKTLSYEGVFFPFEHEILSCSACNKVVAQSGDAPTLPKDRFCFCDAGDLEPAVIMDFFGVADASPKVIRAKRAMTQAF